MPVLAMQHRPASVLLAQGAVPFPQRPNTCRDAQPDMYGDEDADLYGGADLDLYGESDEEDAGVLPSEEESETEPDMFSKSECLKGPMAHVLESEWKGRMSRANSTGSSAPGSPVSGASRLADTWKGHAEVARSPGKLSAFGSAHSEDREGDEPSFESYKATRVHVKTTPRSPIAPAHAAAEVSASQSQLSKGSRVVENVRTSGGPEKESRSLSAASSPVSSRLGFKKHSVSIPDHSSSGSSTPHGTPKGSHGHGRRRSINTSRVDKSLAAEILFGGEELELRHSCASPRVSRKKAADRPVRREQRSHGKSPLIRELPAKGSRSMGHSAPGAEVKPSPTHKPQASATAALAHGHAAGSRSMGHEEGRKKEASRRRQVLNILDGAGLGQDEDCKIDHFDPVDDYLPYLGVGEGVYDKISGCKSKGNVGS